MRSFRSRIDIASVVVLTLAASYGIGASACLIVSPHRSDAVSGEVIGGSSFMIFRSRVSLSGSKLLCPAVVMK
jgi:hypothetical protein